jgi:hypothetical protein
MVTLKRLVSVAAAALGAALVCGCSGGPLDSGPASAPASAPALGGGGDEVAKPHAGGEPGNKPGADTISEPPAGGHMGDPGTGSADEPGRSARANPERKLSRA